MNSHSGPQHQHTLYLKASVQGPGLHSGRPVRLTLLPAPTDAGIVFVRTDLAHPVEIPALARHVVDTTLNTTLGRDGARVGTVEHLLAALRGLGVDNARIEVDGPEVPILDGSAAPWVRLIEQAGVREQKAPRKVAVVRRPVSVSDGDKEVRLLPAPAAAVQCSIDFRHPLVTNQRISLELSARAFVREVAGARTFGFLREVEALRARGLGLGGSLANAIVVDDFNVLNPEGLRWPDEFVRHKVLDAVGDLSLYGMPIIGLLQANKPGHALNHRLVTRLLSEPGHVEIVAGHEPERRPASSEVKLPLGELEGSLA